MCSQSHPRFPRTLLCDAALDNLLIDRIRKRHRLHGPQTISPTAAVGSCDWGRHVSVSVRGYHERVGPLPASMFLK